MRILPALAFLALAVTAFAGPLDGLHFRNGDLLYGELLAIDASNAVRWQHPDAAGPIEFKPDSIAQIDFPTPTNSNAHPTNACRLLLAGGDLLEGSLVSYDHDAVVLQTWYAGRLAISRASLKSLELISTSPEVFAGITGLEGWTLGAAVAAVPGDPGQWSYNDGAFYADKAASIARDLKLPDVAEIQFDLAWKDLLNFAVAFYTDSLQPILLPANGQGPDCNGFYSLRIQDSLVQLWPIKRNTSYHRFGQLNIPAIMNMNHLRIGLRVSKPQHKIALFMNDTLINEWDDPEGFIGEGTAMRFVHNPGGAIKLSNLRITQWDGHFADETSADSTHDAFWREKGVKVIGDIESIANGKMTARTTDGPVEIALSKLRAIDFAHRQNSQPMKETATVRGTFGHGGGLSFVLESWRPNEMLVESADFGMAKINPAAFTRLEFLFPENKAGERRSGTGNGFE